MIKFAHRGASGYAPENTLASFKKAIALAVDYIELDVHALQDGTLVVIHDANLKRTTNGRGKVHEKTLSDLKKLDAGKGEQIPTLQEVLDLVDRKVKVNIEMKGKGAAEHVARLIKEYVEKKGWQFSDFLVSSFNHKELGKFKQILPQVEVCVETVGFFVHNDRYVKELNARSITIYSKLVRRSVIEKAHKKGLKVFVYTVNNKKEMEKMKALGVDGIFSNYPDRIE